MPKFFSRFGYFVLFKLSFMAKPINPFDLFTGGKQPELAIAYNLAHDNISAYINTLLPGNKTGYKPLEHINDLPDEVFVYLRHYMWKGNYDNKNTSGYELDPKEKAIITKLLYKLNELRNFYSHIWHDNYMMAFDNVLYSFIQDKHDIACGKCLEGKTTDTSLYFKQLADFPLFKDRKYITQDGRIFLLSLFLNKGEMQNLLQSLKGYKRTNMPAYQFKHKVYTYYCHREGSSWDNTGIDNKELVRRTDAEQQRILNGRQAYRIFSYIKDIPAFTREAALPLILKSGVWVQDMPALLLFIKEQNILPGFNFYKKFEVVEDGETLDKKQLNEENKLLEKKDREGYRYFMYPHDNSYEFEISYASLKHIVTDIFLDANTGDVNNKSREHFYGILKDCIETRMYVYDNLKTGGDKPLHAENFKLAKRYSSIYIDYTAHEGAMQERYYTGDEWRHIPISPTPKIETLLIEWHGEFMRGTNEKPAKGEVGKRKKLLNLIRPLHQPFDTSMYEGLLRNGKKKLLPDTNPAPLLFHLNYYYREQDTKKRSEDRFLAWAIHYLIDMGLVPDWQFEQEQLKYEQKSGDPDSPYKFKKVTTWAKNVADNFRLYITENHVNVGIEQDGVVYRLRIGEKILKYLLYWHFREPNKDGRSINNFLIEVCKDLVQIYTNTGGKISVSTLKLLEGFAIPELLYKTKVAEETEKGKKALLYKEEVLKFFTQKMDWVDAQLATLPKLTRNGKNEALLNAYRLFDFNETEGQKFLRKNEYEQMSVCHYMLNQEKHKVRGLIERTFKLKRRLPAEVLDIIYAVIETKGENLDSLLVKVLQNRKRFLKQKIDLLNTPGIKNKLIKNEIAGFFDIYLNDANLSTEELAIRNNVRNKTIETLPFSVHPVLTLKYFYPQQFAAQGFRKEGGKHTNVFKLLRQDTRLAKLLPEENFREKETLKIFDNYTQIFGKDKLLKSHVKKWIGATDDIKVKDILLLLIGEDYLRKYDEKTAEEFSKIRILNKKQLDDLFASEITMALDMKDTQVLRSELDEEHKKIIPNIIYISLRMHQLDDYFYRSQKQKLIKLAMFYINWRYEELEMYKGHETITEKINLWPDGTRQKPLTMGQLVEARRVNAGHAAELVAYIFDYERCIINDYTKQVQNKQPQQVLLEYSKAHLNGLYVDFDTVLQWDIENTADIKELVQTLRTKCLHSLIPINGSHRQKTLPYTPIAEALHIHKRLGNDRTASNIYEQDEENEAAES